MWWPFKKKKSIKDLINSTDQDDNDEDYELKDDDSNPFNKEFNNKNNIGNQESYDNLKNRKNNNDFNFKEKRNNVQKGNQEDLSLQIINKNLEVINSKIDTLRAEVGSIDQRLSVIEDIAKDEQKNNKRKRW